MEITLTQKEIEERIENWTNQKQQKLSEFNILEGAIQAYQVLLAKANEGAAQDEPAPDDNTEEKEGDNGSKSHNRKAQNSAAK